MLDDLGTEVVLHQPPRRVVSLVPSLTEAIMATVPEALVGATDWCTHPPGLTVARVRGTKNPNLGAIRALDPDLVIANQEENRRLDVERLRSGGVPVWVTRIDSVEDALRSLWRLFGEVFEVHRIPWLEQAEAVWRRPSPASSIKVAVPVWRDPWMWVGGTTYTDDVLRRTGLVNVGSALGARYPHGAIAAVLEIGPELVLLPDEPYPFSATDGPEAFGSIRTALVPGRALFWYGPAMVSARQHIESALAP